MTRRDSAQRLALFWLRACRCLSCLDCGPSPAAPSAATLANYYHLVLSLCVMKPSLCSLTPCASAARRGTRSPHTGTPEHQNAASSAVRGSRLLPPLALATHVQHTSMCPQE